MDEIRVSRTNNGNFFLNRLLLSSIWEKGKDDDLYIQVCAASFIFPKLVLAHCFKYVFRYNTKLYQLYQSIDYKTLH